MTHNEAKKLKAIQYKMEAHTTHNGWQAPCGYTPTQEELEELDDAAQIARDWNNYNYPDWATIDEYVDDGSSHDKSSIVVWHCDTAIGKVALYSYNNNAWGRADVFVGDEDPGSICDWLQLWDSDNMEQWLKDLADIN